MERIRACFKKNSSLDICPKNFSTTYFRILPQNCKCFLSKILMTIFLVIAPFYDFLAFHISQVAPLSCSLTPHFRPKNFFTTFFKILPRKSFIFVVIDLSEHFLPFRILQMMTPISYCLHTIHPLGPLYTHPHAVFHVSTPCFVIS